MFLFANLEAVINSSLKRKSPQGSISLTSTSKKSINKKPTISSHPKTTKPPTLSTSFDLEITLCPICDEACTCPKTAAVIVKSPLKKKSSSSNSSSSASSRSSSTRKKASTSTSTTKKSNSRSSKRRNVSSLLSSDSEVFYTENSSFEASSDEEETVTEDPALSFIRMIYSDEESLDEEEAYALYQATQLFSSSSEEEEADNSGFNSEDYDNNEYSDEVEDDNDNKDNDTSESDSDDGQFEYTVVEYVQQPRKLVKKTEFVAYDSASDPEDPETDNTNTSNLLINTGEAAQDQDQEQDGNDDNDSLSDSSENWMTYSIFDVDGDLTLDQLSSGLASGTTTSLCSQGSSAITTPETLLFSTSSSDKIPNIAPQVLAAISAAAKHMANQHGNSLNKDSSSTSKYFSYITLKDPSRATTSTTEINNEDEFLFFEEAAFDSEVEGENVVLSDEYDEEVEVFSDCSSSSSCSTSTIFENTDSVLSNIETTCTRNTRKIASHFTTPSTISTSTTTTTTTGTSAYNNFTLNRWNRVPIGAFRRSRRPSIPNYHHIHPSTALKSFSTDPANFTLITSNATGEDSFDESTTIPVVERSQSVVTWDELDLDIDIIPSSNSNNNNTNSLSNPIPKRSKSVVPSASSNFLVNNFEWLNNNWSWEI